MLLCNPGPLATSSEGTWVNHRRGSFSERFGEGAQMAFFKEQWMEENFRPTGNSDPGGLPGPGKAERVE